MSAPDRMTGGELQMVREYLGLTTQALAAELGVRHDTVRRWESGRDRVPERVREEVEQLEARTAEAVGVLVDALRDARVPAVVVYRTDAELAAEHPDDAQLGARWWRHVVARAVHEVPGVEVVLLSDLSPAERAARIADRNRVVATSIALSNARNAPA